MRILRYFINTSLVLSLSFSGLRASEDGIAYHCLDDNSLRVVERNIPTTPTHGVLGFGIVGTTIDDRRLVQPNQNPPDQNPMDFEHNCCSNTLKSSYALRNTNAAQHAASGVYDELDAALKAAYEHDCQEIVVYHSCQRIEKTRAYPEGTEFSIAPVLSRQLSRVNTNNITALEQALKRLREERVVTAVLMGYAVIHKSTIRFDSSKDIMDFKIALEAYPCARAFLTGSHVNSNNSAQRNEGASALPAVRENFHQADENSLINFASYIQRSSIAVTIDSELLRYGQLEDTALPANVTGHFNSQSGNLDSLMQCSNAYEQWINQNLSTRISTVGIIGVESKPIARLLNYEGPILGLTHPDSSPLSWESAEALLEQKLQEQERNRQEQERNRKKVYDKFSLAFKEFKNSKITPAQKKAKEKSIRKLIRDNRAVFKKLLEAPLDSMENKAIHFASFFNLVGLLKELLELGADPNNKNALGLTPLMIAARNGYLKLVNTLLDYPGKLRINDEDNSGWTALTHASATSFEGLKRFAIIGGAAIAAAAAGAAIAAAAAGAGAGAIAAAVAGVGAGAITAAAAVKASQVLGTITMVGGSTAPLCVQLRDIHGSISDHMRLPYSHCKHVGFCTHSIIKQTLINHDAKQAKACSIARTAINSIANLFSSNGISELRYLLQGDPHRFGETEVDELDEADQVGPIGQAGPMGQADENEF